MRAMLLVICCCLSETGAASQDRRQDDSALAGIELASGRKPKDDAEVRGGEVNADAIDSGSVHPGAPVDTAHAVATPGSCSVGDVPTAKNVAAFHQHIVSLGDSASYPETYLSSIFDATRIRDTAVKYLKEPEWLASAPHPFMASVLPGVSFVAVCYGPALARSSRVCAITGDGHLYPNEDLNSLLLSEGYSFDSTELQTIAKVAVLLQCFASPPPRTKSTVWGGRDKSPCACSLGARAFPNVDFASSDRDVAKFPNGVIETRITMLYRVSGVGETAVVDFRRTDDGQNSLVQFTSSREYVRYQPGRSRSPRTGLRGYLNIPYGDGSGLAGTDLAAGRKPKDDTEVRGGGVNADTLDSGSVHPGAPVETGGAVAPTRSDSVGDLPTAKGAEAFHKRIVSLGVPASYAEAWFKEGTAVCPSPDSSLSSLENAAWYESDAHPFLDSVFPGMRVVKVALGTFGPRSHFVVFKDGYTRGLTRLNDILAYRGFSFDSTEMNTIAKIAVLFMYAERAPVVLPLSRRTEGQTALEGDSISLLPSRERAFPSVTFESFKHEPVTHAGVLVGARVTVECQVAGVARTVAVTFSGRTRFIPDGIWTPDGVIRFTSGSPSETGQRGGGQR